MPSVGSKILTLFGLHRVKRRGEKWEENNKKEESNKRREELLFYVLCKSEEPNVVRLFGVERSLECRSLFRDPRPTWTDSNTLRRGSKWAKTTLSYLHTGRSPNDHEILWQRGRQRQVSTEPSVFLPNRTSALTLLLWGTPKCDSESFLLKT